MDAIEKLRTDVEARFNECCLAGGNDYQEFFSRAVDAAISRYVDDTALIAFLVENPEVMNWTYPVWSRPTTPAELLRDAMKEKASKASKYLLVDREFAIIEDLHALVSRVMRESAFMAGAFPALLSEFYELDLGWYKDLKANKYLDNAIGICEVYDVMILANERGELASYVKKAVSGDVSETFVSDLYLLYRLATDYAADFSDRLRKSAEHKLTTETTAALAILERTPDIAPDPGDEFPE